MTIQDLANNPFSTASSPMIGFMEAAPSTLRALSLQIYRFLIEGIREEDQTNGARFVERFLQGPQEAWARTDIAIRSLPDMWSVTRCADRFLPFLKWIVGWTSELDYVTDELDSTTLRRLIAASVPFWKIRGTEEALADILQLTTAARLRIWDWFDLRYIVDEIGMGEEAQGHDPYMINLPGPPDNEERTINVRIVDDGTLNRRLVRNLAALTRPSGERILINYLGFLDLFETDDDTSQWDDVDLSLLGPVPRERPTVANGIMTIQPVVTGYTYVAANPAGASSWHDYVVSARMRGPIMMIEGYQQGFGNSYLVYVQVPSDVSLFAFVGGSVTPLAAVNVTAAFGWVLLPDLFYMLRLQLSAEGGQTRVSLWLDGVLIASVLDSTWSQGTVALPSGIFSPVASDIAEIEMFFIPLEEESVTGA